MKKLSLLILSIFMLGCVSFISCGGVDSQLKMQVEEMNKILPMDAGAGMRIDKITMPESKTLKAECTFTTMTKEELNVEQMEPVLKPAMVQMVKQDPNYKQFIEKNVTIIYVFNDKNGEKVFEVKMKPEDVK